MSTNLHHLQLFYYVAKAKGISAAVKIIPYPVQQPAVSQQIKQLENDLGVELFQRRPFLLTPAGERLFSFLAGFFDNLDAELVAVKDESAVRISLGCPMIISSNYFPELVSVMKLQFTKILPCITEIEGSDLFAQILSRRVDIGVTMANLPVNKILCSKKIISLPMSIVVPTGHAFTEKGFWPKADFPKQQWICLQGSTGGSSELIEGMTLLGATPNFVVSTNSVDAALNYVESGFGICLMACPPRNLIESKKIQVIDASESFGSVELSVVWSNDCSIPNSILEFFIAFCEGLADKYV